MTHLYFCFLRFSLGFDEGRELLNGTALRDFDWARFYAFAQKQTLAGLLMDGIARLPKTVAPPRSLLMEWFGMSQAIRKRNEVLNQATAYVYRKVVEAGFRCCILKGQGNALMYPHPASRSPGDVDVWVDAPREAIRRLARSLAEAHGRLNDESLNHVGLTIGGVVVELHSTPAFMANAVYHHRLQAWLRANVEMQCAHRVTLPDGAGEVAVPTAEFNAVYQLCHLYHHYFYEGVGLRQVVDYGFVNQQFLSSASPSIIASVRRDMRRLGLWKFAGAMAYVLHEVFGTPAERLVAPMDAKRGKLLLDEILCGGNFGRYDVRHSFGSGRVGHNLQRLCRDLRFLRYYPAESLSEPLFRVWHFWWRKRHGEG